MQTSLSAIDAYLEGINELRSMTRGLSTAQLNTRIGPGTWSIQEIVVHILDSDLIATHRMRRMVAEDMPLLVSYDENLFITHIPAADADVDEVLDLFEANRRFTARWMRSLAANAFTREGIHTQRGKVTVQFMLENYTKHIAHHMPFVDGKRAKLGVGAR
jgi:uncharacterized damage-inducible protein DinB